MQRILATAIKNIGSASRLARRIKESPQTVTNWKQRGVSGRALPKVIKAAKGKS